jgi:GntR family carbon starvation induced transcriptional regulator
MSAKVESGPGNGVQATLASRAYAQLRRDIIEARFASGEKLRVRHLCKLYGIGLTPVREALNRASRDGLVCQTDLLGFSVAPLSEQDLEELTRARCWLNEIMVPASMEGGGSDWEERVVLAHYRLSRTARQSGEDSSIRNPAWEKAHREFHLALVSACGSSRLIEFYEQLFDSAARYRFLWSHLGADVEEASDRAHQAIMEAATTGKKSEAVRLLNEHYQRAASRGSSVMRAQAQTAHRARRRGKSVVKEN